MIDIEKLEELPKKEKDRYRNYRHSNPEKCPYTIVNRIIENNIGKSFDLAFHYYCKKVSKQNQNIFLDKFRKRWRYEPDFLVDDNGNIVDNRKPWKKREGKVVFRSWDYRDKEEGYYRKDPITNKFEYKKRIVIISGWYKEFESRKDPEYKNLCKQRAQILRIKKKQYKKEIGEYCEYIMYKTEYERKLKEKNIDNIKIQAHGFDENSFRGIEYHGGKRKRK